MVLLVLEVQLLPLVLHLRFLLSFHDGLMVLLDRLDLIFLKDPLVHNLLLLLVLLLVHNLHLDLWVLLDLEFLILRHLLYLQLVLLVLHHQLLLGILLDLVAQLVP